MKKQNNSPLAQASTKSSPPTLQVELPLLEVFLPTKAEIEAFTAQAGLKIMHALLENEIEQRCGAHGEQTAYRHGTQPG